MILDKQLEFSDTQDGGSFLAASANISTFAYDKEHAFDLGPGENLTVRLTVVVEDVAGTVSTIDFQVVTDTTNAMSSPTVVASSGAIAEAALVVGHTVDIEVPKSSVTEQFIAVNYDVGTADLTAGMFDAYIVQAAQNNETFVS